jgi:hypothetical protein
MVVVVAAAAVVMAVLLAAAVVVWRCGGGHLGMAIVADFVLCPVNPFNWESVENSIFVLDRGREQPRAGGVRIAAQHGMQGQN